MSDERTDLAVEAGAKAFHEAARHEAAKDKQGTLRWETRSEQYRADIRMLVRPAVEAALAASDAYLAAAMPSPTKGDR